MGYEDYGAGYAAFIALYSVAVFIFAIAGYVLSSFFLMKIFEKAGVEGKWRAWVPFYNVMIFFKLGDLSPWLAFGFLLVWIPVLGWLVGLAMAVLGVLAAWRVGLKLQKEGVWVVLYIFLSIVWMGILAFDKSRWNPNIAPAGWAANSFLADRTVWDGIPVQTTNVPGPGVPGYGQGYGAPQGYQQPGYGQPQQPGYAPPQQPYGTQPPAPGSVPPAPPTTPPAPPAPPTAPPTPPSAPTDPNQPPA